MSPPPVVVGHTKDVATNQMECRTCVEVIDGIAPISCCLDIYYLYGGCAMKRIPDWVMGSEETFP